MNNLIQPIHQNNDGLINTYRGKLLDYNNITADMICIDDIAKSLSNICRFGGQIESFYSVAQHTLLVWHLCPQSLKPAALLHDAAEAYTGDIVKPLKNLLGDSFSKFEIQIESVIFEKYGVPLADLKLIKEFDMKALEIENNYFRFGKLDFISVFYDINEKLNFDTPYKQLTALLRDEFLMKELNIKP